MKFIYFFLTIPFYILAKYFVFFNLDSINVDFLKCRKHLQSLNLILDDEIIEILFLAEDHRFQVHYGIDHYAMLRAIYSTHIRKEFQGASTVAQQYVRVITNRYEKSLFRKFREQLLAVLITYEFDVKIIGAAYLNIAFLGSGMKGVDGYLQRKSRLLYELDTLEKIQIVSRLKYPEPLKDKLRWSYKMRIRVENIHSKIA
ncbi:transglycosylase domain-containing protein [Acinetobacter brisouii]